MILKFLKDFIFKMYLKTIEEVCMKSISVFLSLNSLIINRIVRKDLPNVPDSLPTCHS